MGRSFIEALNRGVTSFYEPEADEFGNTVFRNRCDPSGKTDIRSDNPLNGGVLLDGDDEYLRECISTPRIES